MARRPHHTEMQHQERRERVEIMRQRVADLIEADPALAAATMTDLALSVLARTYRPELSAADRKVIRANYSGATDSLIHERALDETGVETAMALAHNVARIALDYSPASAVAAFVQRDQALDPEVGMELASSGSYGIADAIEAGMTPYGALTCSIVPAVRAAQQQGLHAQQILRSLVDAQDVVMMPGANTALDEVAIEMLMTTMGMERGEAEAHLARAKAHLFGVS